MCFTVHVIFLNFYKHSPELSCDTCLAPEEFRRLICGPWPKKVVHHCLSRTRSVDHCKMCELPETVTLAMICSKVIGSNGAEILDSLTAEDETDIEIASDDVRHGER